MNVAPLKDRVLIAEVKKDNVTASGIVIEGRTGETSAGKVLAVGPDVKEVKVDDTVYLDWSKSSVVKVDGVQRVMIKEEDIFAVVE